MECWYRGCTHSAVKNGCSFRELPSDPCKNRIWRRYADIGRCKATPVLCSCHFTETNEMPIPYFENRRKRQRERLQRDDDLQSKAKQRIQSNMDEFLDVDYLIEDDNEVVVIEDTKDTEEEQIILELVELDELTGDEILLLDEMSTIEDVDSPDEKAEYILGS